MQAIDTHAYVDQLVAAGIPEKQARAQIRTILELVTGDLATRQDIQMVKQDMQMVKMEIKSEIDRQCADLNAKLDKQGAELNARIDMIHAKIDGLESKMDARITRMAITVTALLGVLMTIYKFVHF